MKFTLEIELGNDAMQSSEDIINALEEVSKTLARHHTRDMGTRPATRRPYSIIDTNGNTVGKWEVVATVTDTPGAASCPECKGTNLTQRDSEGLYDCCDCGVWFKA